jgi:hypothetical protein
MKYPILKSILAGAAIGAALFAFPFTIRIVGAIVVIGFIVRLIRGPRWYNYHSMHMAWANTRNMSKEEFEKMSPEERRDFRKKMYMQHCSEYTCYNEVKQEKNKPE